jgi:tetratricopeptide (TPR) repeat protein
MIQVKFILFIASFWILISSCQSKVDYQREALIQIEEQDYLGAIIRLNMLIDREPLRDDIYALRADCYMHIWKDSMARIDFLRAIEINPVNYPAMLGLGKLEFNNGNEIEAGKWFSQVTKAKNPRLASDAYIELGRLSYFGKDYPNALQHFNTALNKDSTNSMAWYYRGLLKSRFFDPRGRTDTIKYPYLDFNQALIDFNKALSFDSNLADAYFQKAMVYFNLFNDASGMPEIDKAIEKAPAYVYYYIARAQQHTSMKRFDEALNDINNAININSSEPEVWFIRGYYHTSIGKYSSAKADSAQGIKLQNKRRPT